MAGDQIGCVYNSADSGHKFLRSIQPGQRAGIGSSDELVALPAGDQIYNMSLAAEHDLLKRLDAQLARQRQAAKLKAQNRAMRSRPPRLSGRCRKPRS